MSNPNLNFCTTWNPELRHVDVWVYGGPIAWFDQTAIREVNRLHGLAETGDEYDYERYEEYVETNRDMLAPCFVDRVITGLKPGRIEAGCREALGDNYDHFLELVELSSADSVDILSSHHFRLHLRAAPSDRSRIGQLAEVIKRVFPDCSTDDLQQSGKEFTDPYAEGPLDIRDYLEGASP
jgi:hypothetical protein